MAGRKTHEQFTRILERKPDIDAPVKSRPGRPGAGGAREGDFPESRRGLNQESDHNKHNHPAQGAQKH
jgi:hypothetical protein